MKFCKFSKDALNENYTQISNIYITDYLPYLTETQNKVYLYGIFCCYNDSCENLEDFSKILKISADEIKEAFNYLQNLGLVEISNIDNLSVIFLKPKPSSVNIKLYEDKYSNFNVVSQSLLTRLISPHEYKEYYDLMETKHLEPDALLLIIKYCAETKGENVGYPYILTVAKNWIGEKITKVIDVENKIKELETTSEDIENVLISLGIKRKANLEERDMFRKWKLDFKYSTPDILEVSKLLKKKGGMKALDNKLTKYYEMQLVRIDDILVYEKNKKYYYSLAKEITTKLGVYYDNLDPVIENYLNSWLYKGYSDETLKSLADFCFKTENRSLVDMDELIQKLFKLGLVSLDSIKQYIYELNLVDEEIKNLLTSLTLSRRVTQRDRELYNTWKNVWNIDAELMNYAVTLSKDKTQPFLYFTKILNSYHENNIKTTKEAKDFSKKYNISENKINANINTHSYTDEELNALFDNLKEVDI